MRTLQSLVDDLSLWAERLRDVASSYRRLADWVGDGELRREPPRFPPAPEAAGVYADFDRLVAAVWDFTPAEAAAAVGDVRAAAPPSAFSRRLGVLLRLLTPETLPAAVAAACDDLPDALAALTAFDVVTAADAQDLWAALTGWDEPWDLSAGRAAPAPTDDRATRPFRFADLAELTGDDMLRTLREVNKTALGPALRAVPAPAARRVFAALSPRAAEIVRGDMKDADDAPVEVVAEARADLAAVIARLAAAGEIRLPPGVTAAGQGGGDV